MKYSIKYLLVDKAASGWPEQDDIVPEFDAEVSNPKDLLGIIRQRQDCSGVRDVYLQTWRAAGSGSRWKNVGDVDASELPSGPEMLRVKVVVSSAPLVPGSTVKSSSLMRAWRQHDKLQNVSNTWSAADSVGQKFEEWWALHGAALQAERFWTFECGDEPDLVCYRSGGCIYTSIYRFMHDKSFGDDLSQRRSGDCVFINQSVLGNVQAGQPDLCWGPPSLSPARPGWLKDGRVVIEYKQRPSDLVTVQVQIIDRASSMLGHRQINLIQLPGAASTGKVMQSVLVTHDGGHTQAKLHFTNPLQLVLDGVEGVTDPASGRQRLPVDTTSDAFKELVFHVFLATGQHMRAAAMSSLQLQPGDEITIGFQPDSRRSSAGSSNSDSSFFNCCNMYDSESITCIIADKLSPEHSTRASYAATVASGRHKDTAVVVKLGAAPQYQMMSMALCESWEDWFQVERELAARQGRNFGGVATLLTGGCVTGAPKEELIGSAAAVFFKEGTSLSQTGQPLPRASHEQAVKLLDCGVQAICGLQAVGIFHNDIRPDNIAKRDEGLSHVQLDYYIYDLGLASSYEVAGLYEALSADGQLLHSVCLGPIARYSPVRDLLYGSTATIAGGFLTPFSDFESLLYTVITFLGHELPWTAAAALDDEDGVLQSRKAVWANPQLLPGWEVYPSELRSFVQSLNTGMLGIAPGDAPGWMAVQTAWLHKRSLTACQCAC